MTTTRAGNGTRRTTKPRTNITPAATTRKRTRSVADISISAERQRMLRETAYYLAERRGFAPGQAMADWLTAEAEVTALLEK